MRHFSSAAAAVIALGALIPFGASGQGSLTITNYQFVSETKISRTVSDFAYRADVANTTGVARPTLTATATSSVSSTQVIQGSLHFTNVPANGQVTSTDTFTIRVDRLVVFDFANLHWTFPPPQNPVANAGPDQAVHVGVTVTLNGSGSTNPSGVGTLTYSWTFSSRPAGSSAALANPTSVTPTFVPDVAGAYAIVLTVSNGVGTDSDSVTVNATGNTKPVANAGPDQTVPLGATVTLTGAASTDADGNPLTYAWIFISKPAGSTATLTGANTVSPTFVADKPTNGGINYVVQLIVNDGTINSDPDSVVISTQNTRPVANAGPNQTVTTLGALVQLNGSGSTDADGDPLTFKWSLITVPAGSTAALSSTTIVNPTFVADKAGTYVAQLIVNDGKIDSLASTVTISDTLGAPVANAGTNQTVHQGTTVHLTGSGSGGTGGPYTFQWSLTTKPAGSTASLTNPTSATPTFVADQAGQYVAQLIVNDGSANSAPAPVTINTTNTPPVADAGPNQAVLVGATVTLNGSASSDADSDPLTYSWSLTTKPAGSTATLSGATTVSPTFVADVAGMYVAQLIVSDPFSSSPPKTVNITAGSNQIVLPNANLTLGQSAAFAVTLSSAALAPTTVTLAIGNGSIASLSTTSVSIATGATTPTTQPQVTGIGLGSTTITASAPGYTNGTGNVNVTATGTLTPTPLSITGTATQNLTLTLSANAPTGGVTFNVSSSNTGVATVPATVTIAQGTATVSVPVTGVAAGSTVISATAANVTVTPATVNVAAALTATITPTPATVSLPQTVTLTLTLSQNAPAGGLTFTLSSSNTGVATVPATVTILAANNAVTFPVTSVAVGTTTISATAASVTVTPATVNVVAGLAFTTTSLNSGTIGVAYSQTLATTGGIGTLTFAITAGTLPPGLNFNTATGQISGTPAGTAPSDTQVTFKVTDSSPTPQTANLGPLTLHIAVGSPATITATSGTPQSATVNTAFAAPLVATVKDAGGNLLSGVVVTFNAPGSGASGTFAGGVNTATTNASGVATSAVFTANGTAGTYNVTANVSPSVATPATFALTNLGPASITATSGSGQSAPTGGPFAAPVVATVKDANNNPVPGVIVTFTVNTASGAAAAFAGGVNTATTNASGVATSATLTANGVAGSYTVTANVTPALATPASFTLTNVSTAVAASITATSGTPQSAFVNAAFSAPLVATVKDASDQPVPGAVVTFTVNTGGSGAAGTFPGSATTATATTDVNGVATSPVLTANATGGTFTVTALVSPLTPDKVATFTFANAPIFPNINPPTLGNVAIGQNLEAPLTLNLPFPAPAGGVQVYVTSLNPSLVLLGGQLAAGGPQVVIPVPEGSTTVVGLYAQSMAASGTVQLSIAASGYGNSTATATLTPSGFVLDASGNPEPGVSISLSINSSATLNVSAARLDSSLNFVEVQQLRGPTSFAVTIPLSSSDPSKASVSLPSVTINGGDTTNSIAKVTAIDNTPPATATITAGTPAGYSTPAANKNKVVVTITGKSITTTPVTVAQNLEEITQFSFTPAPAFLTFTITSNDPSKLLLSLTPDAAGQSSITFDTGINAGHTNSPPFFVYGLVNTGSATYTVSASGYTPTTGTVNFVPSAFVIIAPFGVGQGFTTTSGGANVDLTIESIRLDTLDPQAVRGGITVNVPVASSNTSVGTITTSPAVFTGGVAGVNTQFHPLAQGTTNISITTPPGFSTAATGSTVVATVVTPRVTVADGLAIGKGLQSIATLFLNQQAPASGLAVTLTSNSPNLKLSLSPTTAGSSSIVVNIPAGSTNGSYYIQALTDTGSGTYTGTATGFTSGTGTVSFTPSGVVIFGPFGLNSPFPLTTTVAQGPKNFTVATYRLFAGSLATDTDGQQQLAGGSSLSIVLNNSNPAVGTVPSPVTINGGSDSVTPLFTPLSVGNTTISVIKPAAFSQPADNTTLQVRVNP